MDARTLFRTGFFLFCLLSPNTLIAAQQRFTEPDLETASDRSFFNKQVFQQNLSGLYSIDSWKAAEIRQPYPTFSPLYQAARGAQQELDGVLKRIGAATATKPLIANIKSAHRAKEKIATDLQGDCRRITDLARGSLIADDIPTLVQAFEQLSQELTIVSVKNRFKTPAPSGYRDLNVLVRLPQSQLVAEVQFHLAAIAEVKSGPEHQLYEHIQQIERRGLEENRALSPLEQAKIARLRQSSQQLYQTAWQQYLQPRALAS
ncbi:RelA/SpoT domain-containing protein [Photobacterium atrarenae]|uniref:RelA/SpoT domain-containing protein n=1 Tax=Photobacterium atrarenae TaxID=865757 RepID=A0ABY5GK91_9GAMM|nr:RelA/SpoT domain-containing protein [Photobacterium atrarenae]UTV29753.1 RelA/SpoT domain-containing protein [Photobacterium atrarenae]